MVDDRHFRSDEPDNYNDNDFQSTRPRRYAFGRSADFDSVPLFLSDPDGEPDPEEFANPLRPYRGASVSLRILIGVVAASAVAVLFAWFTSDATRDVLVSAKASLSTVLPIPSASAQPEMPLPQPPATQLTTRDVQLKDPARWQGADAQAETPPTVRGPQVAMAPSRDDISSAYQSALQNRTAPAAAPPAVAIVPPAAAPIATAPPARQLDPEEIAVLMKRAKDMLASGDIPPARLLLRRAADAQEPNAALLLAQTYDPNMLGTQDVRNINPDIAMARTWYQRAAELGSADAQRRLAQLQN
jgi:hypothetical protein